MNDPPNPLLERIANALERIAPQAKQATDWLSAPAYLWNGQSAHSVMSLDAWSLDRLHGIDIQKVALRNNCIALSQGAAAHDMILWGARGMGKSALVRATIANIQDEAPSSIALVQIANHALDTLPELFVQLADQPRAFVLFCDDLTFDERDISANLALRSLLDGGVVARPAHIRFAVTSNRRALTKQADSQNETNMHNRDERDHVLALADRFGLSLGFHPCNQATYIEIVSAYLEPLGLAFEANEAKAWAIERGNRSGRTAYQFAVEIAGKAGKSL